MTHDVKMVYEQGLCPKTCSFVDCPLLYLESCFQPVNSEPYSCELFDGDLCREDFEIMPTRQVVECRQLKNFSAYVERCDGFWGVLKTNRGERRCDYLEVDGGVIFDHEQSHNIER